MSSHLSLLREIGAPPRLHNILLAADVADPLLVQFYGTSAMEFAHLVAEKFQATPPNKVSAEEFQALQRYWIFMQRKGFAVLQSTSKVKIPSAEFETLTSNEAKYGLAPPPVPEETSSSSGQALAVLPPARRLGMALAIKMKANDLKNQATSVSKAEFLRDKDQARKRRWTERFIKIGQRAHAALQKRGSVCTTIQEVLSVALSDDDAQSLLFEGLGRGSWRTIRQYTGFWLNLEAWFNIAGRRTAESSSIAYGALDHQSFDSIYPLSSVTFCRYIRYIIVVKECGPSIPDAVRTAFIWIGRRLGFTVSVDSPLAQAMMDNLVLEKGQARRAAIPFAIEHLLLIEEGVGDRANPSALRLIGWWVLTLVYGTLRSNDALHSCPDLLELHDTFMGGESWRTKVDRAGRGTKWTVVRSSFSGKDWVADGFGLLKVEVPVRRDYLLDTPTPDFQKFLQDRPMEYDQALIVLRLALIRFGIPPETAMKITLHSPRATVPTLAAHAGKSDLAIKCQGNWESESQPKAYVRRAGEIPIAMLEELSLEVRDGWRPRYEEAITRPVRILPARDPFAGPQHEVPRPVLDLDPSAAPEPVAELSASEASVDDPDEQPVLAAFFKSKNAHLRAVHVESLLHPGRSACKRIILANATPVGAEIPSGFSLCSWCARNRPTAAPRERALIEENTDPTDDRDDPGNQEFARSFVQQQRKRPRAAVR